MNTHHRQASVAESFIFAMTAFGFSCLAFLLSVVVLIPLTAAVAAWLGLPDLICGALILFELFGVPVLAAIKGIRIAVQPADVVRPVVDAG